MLFHSIIAQQFLESWIVRKNNFKLYRRIQGLSDEITGSKLWMHTPNHLRSSIWRWRGGAFSPRGALEKVLCGKASPWGLTPYNFFKYRFWSKGYPFRIPYVDKWYPFSYALALGREKEGESLQYVSSIWIPPSILLWFPFAWAVRFPPISAKGKRARRKTNIEKHVPRVMTSLPMSSAPISILHRLFRCRYSNPKLSFLFPPHRRSAPESLLPG